MENESMESIESMESMEKDVHIVENILELVNELTPATKDVITFQIKKGLEILEAKAQGKEYDVSEEIDMITQFLGFDLNRIVAGIMNVPLVEDEDIKLNSSDEDVLNFLQSVDECELDKYKEKLQELKDI